MQKITITSISRNEKTSKDGKKKYISLGLRCAEYGERWINGFGNKDNQDWKEGDEVSIDIKEVEVNGKKYLNFETPDVTAFLIERVKTLEETMEKVRTTLKPMYLDWKATQPKDTPKVSGTEIDYPSDDINPSDINF